MGGMRWLLLAKQLALGGAAALEGVMMKAPWAWALAVRLPDGRIHVERHEERALTERYPWTRLPLLRGVVALFDALSVSYRALARSAELAGGEEVPQGALWGTVAVSLLVGIALFIVFPGFLAGLFVDAARHPVLHNLLAGLLKVGILVGYLRFIGRMPEIQRFFMYHGAEHKAIHAYEKGLPLTVENVLAQPRFHPRCGTTFIAFVIVVSVLVYSLIPAPEVLWWRLLARVLFLPLVAALAYELLYFSARHQDPFSRLLRELGFRFQALTVAEPTPEMVEVAIRSTEAALGEKVVGEHEGASLYTLGQRKGLGLYKTHLERYVVGVDPERNVVYVGPKEACYFEGLEGEGLNLLAELPEEVEVQVRYRTPPVRAKVESLSPLRLRFAHPVFAVTPGQSAVFYRGERLLGGAVIRRGLYNLAGLEDPRALTFS